MTSAPFRIVALGGYVLVVVVVVFGLYQARRWAETVYSAPAAHSQWNSFRDDVDRQSETGGPVRRRVPKSVEPPALVLTRDYFASCAVISVVLTTALYATLTFFIGGVVGESKRTVRDSSGDAQETNP